MVVDLPTAFYLTAAEVAGSKIVGQFSAPGGDRWGALLEKDSELTDCVSQAIDDADAPPGSSSGSRTSGWAQAAGAPELD